MPRAIPQSGLELELTGKLPPHSIEAEQTVIAAVLNGRVDPVVVRRMFELLDTCDFYYGPHSHIWRAMRERTQTAGSVDFLTTLEGLKHTGTLEAVGGIPYLTTLAEAHFFLTDVWGAAEIVKAKAELRYLGEMCMQVAAESREPDAEPGDLQEWMTRMLLATSGKAREEAVCYADALEREVERIKTGGQVPTLEFGIRALDVVTDGLGRGEVGIICGRPGTGKSTALAQQLHHGAETWGPALYISLEMADEELVRRDLAGLTGFTYRDLRKSGKFHAETGRVREFTAYELRQVEQAYEALKGRAHKIWIDEHAKSLTRLISRCHRYRLQYGINFIILDYGQLVSDDTGRAGKGKAEEVMNVARAIKNEVAKPLNVPVWVAVQANRESEKGEKKSMLTYSSLGWSSEWEAVAGRVLFLNSDPMRAEHDDASRTHVLVDVHKNRHGMVGHVPLVMDRPRFRFLSEDPRFQDLEPQRRLNEDGD